MLVEEKKVPHKEAKKIPIIVKSNNPMKMQ